MRLVVELSESGELWRHVLLSDAGVLEHNAARADACAAGLLPAAADVVAVIPAQRCAWHRLSLPKVAAPKLRAALDGALEEALLQDTSQTHVAVLEQAGTSPHTWVLATDKAWLNARLQSLQDAGRSPSQLVAAFTPLPEGAATQLWLHGTDDAPQLTISRPNGAFSLPLASLGNDMAQRLGLDESTTVTAEPHLAARLERMWEHKVQVQPWMSQLASRASPSALAQGNLAQFDLAHHTSGAWSQRLRKLARAVVFEPQWQALRWGALAFALVNLVGLNVLAHRQESQLAAKRAAINQTLTQTFPEVSVVVDAPVQMQKQLDVLRKSRGALGPTDFENLLGAWAQQQPPAANAQALPTSLEFNAGRLVVNGSAMAQQNLARAQQSLRAQGLNIQNEGANTVVEASADSNKAKP
jgi:general secretion pathway protein L